jgi:hypothetical protein
MWALALMPVIPGNSGLLPALLGQGVNPLTLETEGFAVDLGPLQRASGNQTSAQSTTYRYLEINDLSQLLRELNISASMSLKAGLFGNSSGGFSLAQKFQKNTSYRFLLIEVNVANEQELASSFTFKPQVQQSIRAGLSDAEFTENYGTQFVFGRVTGGRLYALVEIELTSEQSSSEINAAISTGVFFGTGRAEFNQKLNEINISAKTRVYIEKIGGRPGLPRIDGITDFALKFDSLVSSLDSPVTLELLTKDYSGVEPIDLEPNLQALIRQELFLNQIAGKVESARELLSAIESVKSNLSRYKIDADVLRRLDEDERKLTSFLNVYSAAAVRCFESIFECTLPEDLPLPTVILPDQKEVDALVRLTIGRVGDRELPLGEFTGFRDGERQIERFMLTSTGVSGLSFRYFAHLQGIGDTEFVREGNFVGTVNEDRRLEGISIELVGPNAGEYDVFYMAFQGVSRSGQAGGIGDTPMFSNGQFCGTRGESRALAGIKVFIQRK